MKIEKLSKDFTPRHKGLFFGIDTENENPLTLEVEIVEAESGEVVATQLLREITSAEVNIAPYVKPFTEYCPSPSAHTTFCQAPAASYLVRVNDTESEPLRVSVNRADVEHLTIVTSMPNLRYMNYGESDEILLIASPGDTLTANIYADADDSLSVSTVVESGVATLVISPKDFKADARTLSIELLCNGVMIDELCYNLRRSRRKGVRLAWLSDKGMIERYTFPMVIKKERKTIKEGIVAGSERCVVKATTDSLLLLSSRYEPRQTIQALAEIVSSSKVWLEDGEEHRLVEVKNSSIESDIFGLPNKISLTISEWNREEVIL